jgi:NDP-sugar pyrophosphorylase family protein
VKGGIIAAGVGSRLAQGGVVAPKPLVRVAGDTLIGRVIREMAAAGAASVAVITTPAFPQVAAYLRREPWPLPVSVTEWASPHSLASLLALRPFLDEPFVLSTVDAILAPGALARFAAAAQAAAADGALALTSCIDDEKPLYVELGPDHRVLSVGRGKSPWITAGCYAFTPRVFDFEAAARARRLSALRQFLAFLAEAGFTLTGIDVGPAVDVDHPEDLARAEAFLRSGVF